MPQDMHWRIPTPVLVAHDLHVCDEIAQRRHHVPPWIGVYQWSVW
jgi:hypothetical protein